MTISTKPNITLLWADEGSYEAPDDAKILQGWVAEIPPFESQNWWQHRADEALRHIFQAGIAVWDASTLYTANRSIVQSSEGTLWRAVIDNTGQNPISTSGVWAHVIQESRYVPPGAIMDFAMITPPEGWLICDGAPVSRTAYATLFAAVGTTWGGGDGSTTFNKPDLRGVFRRGVDLSRGLDPSRTLASQQASANLQHSHSGTTAVDGVHLHGGTTSAAGNHNHSGITAANGVHDHPATIPPAQNAPGYLGIGGILPNWNLYGSPVSVGAAGNHQHGLIIDYAGGHTHPLSIDPNGGHQHTFATNVQGGSESRPINVAILPCIKY